ncbi:cation diffusion facilitator family transporter [Campylobacter helveticus]|uniref:cation diffusion facilitator family transporter n=1 Tax=Campylobacter helveticus TaxID=28898 RepID=UPI002149B6DE|nr:cation diffusion facilitator family transporter [Campylobacter helveticus]MCR2066065.1 cation diffusion facilitator family transporter [Campylobacter helveticus]
MYNYLSHQPLLKACKHSHEHAHNHEHSHADVRVMDKKILSISLMMTASMMLVQFIYALLSNSLALLSDTLHMFSDVFALTLSLLALIAVQKWQNEQKTFGYFRLEVLVAFINALSIILSAIFIIYESIYKLFYPEEIDAKTMIIVAFLGLLVNAFNAFLMFKNTNLDNLNMKSAFYHMMSDLLGSCVVVVGGIVVYFSKIVYIDSLLALILALLLLRWAVILLKQSTNILLESSPVDINEVKAMLLQDERVDEVFDLHITQITNKMLVATMHIKTPLKSLDEFELLSKDLAKNLLEKFHIGHSTIQALRSKNEI